MRTRRFLFLSALVALCATTVGAATAQWPARTPSAPISGTPLPLVIQQARDGRIARTRTETVQQAAALAARLRAQGVIAQVAVQYALPSDPVTGQPFNRAVRANIAARAPRGSAPTQSWLREIDVPRNPRLGRGITVAVIDTGADTTHPHLRRILANGRDVADGDNDPSDRVGHGTHTAGIVHSVAPGASIMPVKVFSDTDYADDATLAAGIDWAIARKAQVISMSLGRYETPDFPAPILHAALERAIRAKIIVVAASGNANTLANQTVPNNHPGVVSVEATYNGVRTFFSNYGDEKDEWVVAAPGWNILSSVPEGQYAAFSGTSMSCPMVSGALAALLGQNKGMKNDQAVTRLLALKDEAVRWKNEPIPHLNVAALLGTPKPLTVYGQALNGLAGTYSGANLSGATVSEGGHVLGTTDARGGFAFRLKPGQHHLTLTLPGFIAGEVDVTVEAGKMTRLAKPVILIPERSDDAISVVVVSNSFHSTTALAESTLNSLPEPAGGNVVTGIRDTRSDAVYGVGSFLPLGGDLGTGSLLDAPFAAQTRVGYGPPWTRIDFAPVDGFVILPGTLFQVEVSNFHSRLEFPPFEEGMPPFAVKDGRPFAELGLEVIVARKDKILGRFTPPANNVNDLPLSDFTAFYTFPRWNACQVGLVGGKVVVKPVGTIVPPTLVETTPF